MQVSVLDRLRPRSGKINGAPVQFRPRPTLDFKLDNFQNWLQIYMYTDGGPLEKERSKNWPQKYIDVDFNIFSPAAHQIYIS